MNDKTHILFNALEKIATIGDALEMHDLAKAALWAYGAPVAQGEAVADAKRAINFGPGKDGQYTVRWEIDVTASSAHEAAQHARNIMKNPGSGNVLDVRPKGETAYCTRIDLANTGRMPGVPACVIVGDIATGFNAYGPYENAGAAQDDAANCWDSAPAFTRNICDPSDTDWPVDHDEPQPFVVLCGQVGEELDAHGPWKCDVAENFAKHMRDSLGYVTIILPLDPIPTSTN